MAVFKNNTGKVRAGWKIAVVICIFAILSAGSGITIAIIMMVRGVTYGMTEGESITSQDFFNFIMPDGNSGILLVILTLFQAGAMIFAVWLGMRVFEHKGIVSIGLNSISSRWKELLFGIILGAVSITVIFAVLIAEGSVTVSPGGGGIAGALAAGIITYVLVALNEELFSRGYCMTVLKQTGKTWIIFIVSSAIFMAMHALNPNLSVIGLVNLFLAGLLFALMYYMTRSLWMPIGYHFSWNFFQGTVFGFSVSGMGQKGLVKVRIAQENILNGGAFGPEGGILVTILIAAGVIATWKYCTTAHEKARALNET